MDQSDILDADDQIGINANYYVGMASLAILYYDYFLTLPMEVDRFWTIGWPRFTWASILFFVNRYLTIIGHLPFIVEILWVSPNPARKWSVCHALIVYHQYFVVVVQLTVGALLVLRTYALYDRSRIVLGFLLTVSAIIVACACYAIYSSKQNTMPFPQALPVMGCRPFLSLDANRRLAAAWGGSMIFDILIFTMTVYKSLTSYWRGTSRRLVHVLLRDGAVYFAVMALATLSNILTFMVAPVTIGGVTATFTNVISSTLISRLVLRLRDPKLSSKKPKRGNKGDDEGETALSEWSTTNHRALVSTLVSVEEPSPHDNSAWAVISKRDSRLIGIELVSRN